MTAFQDNASVLGASASSDPGSARSIGRIATFHLVSGDSLGGITASFLQIAGSRDDITTSFPGSPGFDPVFAASIPVIHETLLTIRGTLPRIINFFPLVQLPVVVSCDVIRAALTGCRNCPIKPHDIAGPVASMTENEPACKVKNFYRALG